MSNGLLGSTALEVAIGLSFVYLLLALLCTTVNEWIAGMLGSRSKLLEESLRQLLDNQPHDGAKNGFVNAFYGHPLIQGMMRGDKHPSYLSARTFATVVLDLVGRPAAPSQASGSTLGPAPDRADAVRSIDALPDGDVKDALRSLMPPEGGDFSTLRENVEGWFNDAMDRVSGWYKRRTQIWTILVALVITVAANADTFRIARQLWSDPTLRESVVAEAKVRAAEPRPSMQVDYLDPRNPTKPTVTRLGDNPIHQRERDLLGQMMGWGSADAGLGTSGWLLRLLGWLISCVAISLGAPFWFDTLNKFINIRSAGKSPGEAAKSPSKAKLPPANQAA